MSSLLYVAIYPNPACEAAFQWHIAGTRLEIATRPLNDDVFYVDAKTLGISNKDLVALREFSYHLRHLYLREVPPGRRDDDPTLELTPAYLRLRDLVKNLMCRIDKAVALYLLPTVATTPSSLSATAIPAAEGKN